MPENWGKSIFCPMDKKMIFLQIELCIVKCPGLCFFSLKLAIVTLSSCSYLDFWDILVSFHFYA